MSLLFEEFKYFVKPDLLNFKFYLFMFLIFDEIYLIEILLSSFLSTIFSFQ
jgi:hypothetical protein